MKWREFLSRCVLLPIGKTYAGRDYLKAKRHQRFLEKTQYWNRQHLEELRDGQFRELMAHCYANVPFYRQYMDEHHLTVNDFATIADVAKLPLLTKDILKHNLAALTAANYKKKHIRYETTGGTTGTPGKFGIDLPNEYKSDANNWRFWKYAEYTPGVKTALFWAHPFELALADSARERLKSWMNNTTLLSAWHLSEQRLAESARELARAKPDVIRGYASAVYLFAHYCREKGITLSTKPKSVVITADKIFQPQKTEIAKFFGCEVFEEYGCREFSSILAHECERHTGLHLSEEHFIFEVLNPATGGCAFDGAGEIVVTSLLNCAIPLLRYRLGDEVNISRDYCACGRTSKVISDLKGRIVDYVVTNSNKTVRGTCFTYLFKALHGISRFQVHQYEKGRVVFFIIKNELFSEKEIAHFAAEFRAAFKDDLTFAIEYVDDIMISPSGKRRIFISHLTTPSLPSYYALQPA